MFVVFSLMVKYWICCSVKYLFFFLNKSIVLFLFLRPDIIDPAILRPGRLDQLIYIPLPDEPVS